MVALSGRRQTTHAGADHHGIERGGGVWRTAKRWRVSRELGIEQTYYRWRQDRGMKVDQADASRMEKENARLKRAVANLTVDKLILEEATKGNF